MGWRGLSPPNEMIYLKSEVLLRSERSVFLILYARLGPQSTLSYVLYARLYRSCYSFYFYKGDN